MDDVNLQRAIYNSIHQTRGSAGATYHSYATTSSSFSAPRPARSRDIAPTIPHRVARPIPQPRRSLGHRDTLQREGIAPVTPSQQALSDRSGNPTVTLRRRNSSPLRRSEDSEGPSALTKASSYYRASQADKGFAQVSPKVSTAALLRGLENSFGDSEDENGPVGVPSSSSPQAIAGWSTREPIEAHERKQVQMMPQNPSGSQFTMESPPECNACYICTRDNAEDILKRTMFTISAHVKLLTKESELFFFALDYKQRGREPGAFVSVSISCVSGTCRIERYSKGRRTAVFCECVDKSLKANTWYQLKVVVRGNGSRISFYNGPQQVFKDIDVSEGLTHGSLGEAGLGVFHAKALIKEFQLAPGDVSSSTSTSNGGITSRGGGGGTTARAGALSSRAAGRNIGTSLGLPRGASGSGGGDDQFDHLEEVIQRDVMTTNPGVTWESIAALDDAKRLLNEAVILPLIIPEFFTGIRQPWKGILLYGPPGTGKTMLAKAVASCANTTFFNCSASTLVSKYHGESEKLVKVLFQMARRMAPSTIFIDEIDALMMARGSSTEHEASRRLKSEILSQIDGMHSGTERELIMVLATTNKPWDLDDALRRRLEKRIYIPLPDERARYEMFRINLQNILTSTDVDCVTLARMTDGYSGSDIHQLCRDACMMPVRRLIASRSPNEIKAMKDQGVLDNTPITMADFLSACANIRPSVSATDLRAYDRFREEFGSL